MTSPPTTAMSLEVDAGSDSDYASIKRPTRTYFIIYQGFEFCFFVCITLCVVVFFLIYIVLITFTMLPLAIVSRKWSNISAWYLAPTHLQSHVYAYYRKTSKRLASEWDIEKAKPMPLAQLQRGFVSQELVHSPQTEPDLITKLPAEIRLQIYREVILGNSTHVHIAVHRTQRSGRKRPTSRMHGQFCRFHITRIPVNDCRCFDVGSCGPKIPRCQAPYPENSGRGILALSKTCKQVYMETIDLLYNLPTFYFNSLSKPPFFLQSLLPQRLAQIKHIQLCYHTRHISKTCTQSTRHSLKLQRQHNLQQCNSCNIHLWLDTIRKTMTGLESIEMFMYLDKHVRIPSIDDEWVPRLFKLQRGANGLRRLKIQLFFDRPCRILPLPGPAWTNPPLAPTSLQVPQADLLDHELQEMIRKGAASRVQEGKLGGEAGSGRRSEDVEGISTMNDQ